MKVHVTLLPFKFPNFIFFTGGPRLRGGETRPKIAVHELTDEQASDYWKAMRKHWMDHVRKRRKEAGS